MLIVWEPILPSDWAKPGGMVLSRVSDSRVVQFWDGSHLVSTELKRQFPSAQRLCCQHNGILWDVAALYPSKVDWGTSTPVFFGGAVLDIADKVRQQLSATNK